MCRWCGRRRFWPSVAVVTALLFPWRRLLLLCCGGLGGEGDASRFRFVTDFFGFFFPCFVCGTISQVVLCCFVSGEQRHGGSEGGVLSSLNDGGFPVSMVDDSMRYFFQPLRKGGNPLHPLRC